MDSEGSTENRSLLHSKAWRRGLFALGALLFSALLLGVWVKALAAPNQDSTPPKPERDSSAPTADYDFGITKSQVPLTFTVGSNNKYYLNVAGIITTTANNPSVVDDLPDGMTLAGTVNAPDWDCGLSTATEISCIYGGDLPAVQIPDPPSYFSLSPIIFNVNVSPEISPTVVQNTAVLVSTGDRDPTNNSDTITTTVDSVDLEITKEYTPTLIFPGDPITFTMVITNYGPLPAKKVKVTDKLSTYLNYDAAHTVPSGYDSSTGIWTFGDLGVGISQTLILRANANSDSLGKVVVNTAKVASSNKSDWYASNNQDSVTFTIGWIEVKKTVSPTTKAYAGQDVTFTITVKNVGAEDAENVVLNDTFPFNTILDLVDDSATRGTNIFLGNTLENNLGTLSPGQTATIVVIVKGKSSLTTTQNLSNYAIATWDNTTTVNPNDKLSQDSETVTIQIVPAANLLVTKSDGLSDVYPGQNVDYTIAISNTGTMVANNVRIVDTFSNYLSYASINAGSLALTQLSYTAQSRTWRLDNPLAAGERVSFKIRLNVASDAPLNSTVKNTVQVTTDTTEISTTDNSASDSDTVLPKSELQIIYTVAPTLGQVGDNLTFKVTVRNRGESTVNSIVVADGYPGVLDLSSASASKGTVTTNSSSRSWIWNLGSLDAGKAATLTVVTKVNSTATTAETYRTAARMTYGSSGTQNSNSIAFRVLPAGTLPGTGGAANDEANRLISYLALGVGLFFAALGMIVLALSLWARRRRPLWFAWYLRAGLLLFAASLAFGAVAWQVGSAASRPQEILALTGEKPIFPTHTPTQLPPPTETLVLQPVDLDVYLPTPTPDRLPDYPIPTPTIKASPSLDGGQPDPSAATRIVIPAIGVDTVVKYVPFNGETWLIGGLKQEVAWMGDTSWPGLGGNTGLAGHVDLADGSAGPFWRLKELKSGDVIMLYTEKNIYTYQMRAQVTVEDYDLSVIAPTEKPQLTLITCINWDATLHAYVQRLVVYADLVEVEPIANQ